MLLWTQQEKVDSGQIMGHQDLGHDAGHPKPNIIWAIGGYQYPLPLMVKMIIACCWCEIAEKAYSSCWFGQFHCAATKSVHLMLLLRLIKKPRRREIGPLFTVANVQLH